jgi:ribosome biogenesis GTPase A
MSLPSEKKYAELKARMTKLGIKDSDLSEKFILGGGKGGQKQNKTANCVQLKHEPTGTVVKCQKERSRESNRFFAKRLLCEKIEESRKPETNQKHIQWFPGHMAKARRQIEEKLPKIDVIIEILDARAPLSSRNPIIDELAKDKARILILNKIDLADPSVTTDWQQFFKKEGLTCITTNILDNKGVTQIHDICKRLIPKKAESDNLKFSETRLMIVGIPNVGKSALINRLAKRKIADVQDRPAVTKRQQWIPLESNMALLDTPGILWPKFEDQEIGKRLAICGSIKDHILDSEDIAFWLIKFLVHNYAENLIARYKIELSNKDDLVAIMEEIGSKRGYKTNGGHIDYDRVYYILFQDFRKGKLGRITLEKP